jgi:hypothetical protein
MNYNDYPTPNNTDLMNDNNIGYETTKKTDVMNDNDYPTPNNTDVMNDTSNDYSPYATINNNETITNIATSGQWEVAGWLEVQTNKKFSKSDTTKGNMFELDYLQNSLRRNCSCDLPPGEMIYPRLKPDHSFLALVKQLDPLVGDVLDNKMITLCPQAWLSSNTINALCDIWNRLPHFRVNSVVLWDPVIVNVMGGYGGTVSHGVTFRRRIDYRIKARRYHILLVATKSKGTPWIGLKLDREDPAKINVCRVSKRWQSMYGKEMGYAALKALQYMFPKIRFNRCNENDEYIEDQNGSDCGIILLRWVLLHGLFGSKRQPKHVQQLKEYNYSRLMFAVAIDRNYWFVEDEAVC